MGAVFFVFVSFYRLSSRWEQCSREKNISSESFGRNPQQTVQRPLGQPTSEGGGSSAAEHWQQLVLPAKHPQRPPVRRAARIAGGRGGSEQLSGCRTQGSKYLQDHKTDQERPSSFRAKKPAEHKTEKLKSEIGGYGRRCQPTKDMWRQIIAGRRIRWQCKLLKVQDYLLLQHLAAFLYGFLVISEIGESRNSSNEFVRRGRDERF